MTSGQFTSVPIDTVFVDRAERQRKELDQADIEELARSISRIGLINPITIERSGKLRAGETRWNACKFLGWTHIPVQFVEDLDEPTLQLLELDENLKRKQLPWQDECDAVYRYHNLRLQLDPTWNQNQTAEALGMSAAAVSQRLDIKEELIKPDSKIHGATKLSEARTIVTRITARRNASVLSEIEGKPKPEERAVPLINADFIEWQKTYSGPKFNLIHCDFPYGINADNQQQGINAIAFESYADSEDIYWNLLSALEAGMTNVVAESAHLIFWYSMRWHNETVEILSRMGWKVDPFPLLWLKSDNAGLLPDPKRGPRRIYETALFASRGDRYIVQPVANAIAAPTTKKIHMSEKPLPVLRHFFRMVLDDYSTVLDPTAGSGNSIRAAVAAGAASALGIEQNPTIFSNAKEHFHDID